VDKGVFYAAVCGVSFALFGVAIRRGIFDLTAAPGTTDAFALCGAYYSWQPSR